MVLVLCCKLDVSSSGVNGRTLVEPEQTRLQELLPSIAQQAYLKASNTDADDRFGFSVALYHDTLAVGALNEDSSIPGNQNDNNAPSAGAAYIFVRNGNRWSQEAYLKASTPAFAASFGYSIAISRDTAVVGALGEDAAYVFVRNGTNWTQQAFLRGSNTAVEDDFGSSVAISGDTLVVGAQYEGSSAIGVNGNQNDNGAPRSGAAYVFVRTGTNWTQQAYLKASNTGPGDRSDWLSRYQEIPR
jgi:trimeric autotransporter adhesin